jgi:hypothetical protein
LLWLSRDGNTNNCSCLSNNFSFFFRLIIGDFKRQFCPLIWLKVGNFAYLFSGLPTSRFAISAANAALWWRY